MKPALILQGHSRPVKKILFSCKGDILFTASSDRNIISWVIPKGDKYKTYSHSAAVNTICLTKENDILISGDNTGCSYFWNVLSGALIKKFEHDPILSVRSIDTYDQFVLIVYAGRTKQPQSFINVYNINEFILEPPKEKETQTKVNPYYNSDSIYSIYAVPKNQKGIFSNNKASTSAPANVLSHTKVMPVKHFECQSNTNTKYACSKFIATNAKPMCLLSSREDGYMELMNYANGAVLCQNKFHEEAILDFDVKIEKNIVLSCAKDGTACMFDLFSFEVIMTFRPDPGRNLNCCRILNIVTEVERTAQDDNLSNMNMTSQTIFTGDNINVLFTSSVERYKEALYCVVAGGQDSKLVTTTKQSGFDVMGYSCDTDSKAEVVINTEPQALISTEGSECNTVEITSTSDNPIKNVIEKIVPTFSMNFHFGPVNTLEYSDISKFLASGSEDSSVKLYSLNL